MRLAHQALRNGDRLNVLRGDDRTPLWAQNPVLSRSHPQGSSRTWAAYPALCECGTGHRCLCASESPGSRDLDCSLLWCSTSHVHRSQSAVAQDSAPQGQGEGMWAPVGGALVSYKAVRMIYIVESIFRKHSLPCPSKQWRGESMITPILSVMLREVRTFT